MLNESPVLPSSSFRLARAQLGKFFGIGALLLQIGEADCNELE